MADVAPRDQKIQEAVDVYMRECQLTESELKTWQMHCEHMAAKYNAGYKYARFSIETLKLSRKIMADTGIVTFPWIQVELTHACHRNAGNCLWSLYAVRGAREVLGRETTRECVRKTVKLIATRIDAIDQGSVDIDVVKK